MFGVRRLLELKSPRIFTNDQLSLPRNATYHFYTKEEGVFGPNANDTLLIPDHQKIPIYFVDNLITDESVQRKKVKVFTPLIRDYIHNSHARFRYHKTFDEDLGKSYLSIISYSIIDMLYIYKPLPLMRYDRWKNFYSTIYSTINQVAADTKSHQFLIMDMPNIIPSRSYFLMFGDKNKKSMFRVFTDNAGLNLLDFWRWIDPETREMSALNQVQEENYEFVNIIIRYQDLNYILNLKKLWDFMTPTDKNKVVLNPNQLQKVMLRSIMSLHDEKDKRESKLSEDIIQSDDPAAQPIQPKDNDTDDNRPEEEFSGINKTAKMIVSNEVPEDISTAQLKAADNLDAELTNITSHQDEIAEVLKDLDKDLEEIDQYSQIIEKDQLISDENVIQQETIPPKEQITSDDAEVEQLSVKYLKKVHEDQKVLDEIQRYKDIGVFNLTDYKSNMRTYQKFQNMTNPYTEKENFNEYIKIKPEHLHITTEEKKLHVTKGIVDDRMAQTTITALNDKYLKNIITKDTLSMSKSIMNAGIMIDSYDIDQKHDALGDYEIHSIRVKPILGAPSVIHFKLPIVNEDGEMKINSKIYYLRKQRVDIPIRKINDSEVALTSYYGKAFIRRDYKVVNNLSRWLSTNIRKQILSDNPTPIVKAVSSNVFDSSIKVPRLYSALAKEFLRIETKDVVFYFDYNERDKLISPEALKKLEGEDKIFFGYEKSTKNPIFVNYDDELLIYNGMTFKSIQNFYSLVGVNPKKVPVEHVTFSVFSKDIPVAVILGYLMGLDNLIKLLKPKHRLIPANKLSKLDDFEYEIRFKDYKLILDKREIKNSLILSGFIKFPDLTKELYLEDMNTKNPYFDFYKEMGVTSIYIKETDLENEMFIDPITLGILQERHEPETFIGLLIYGAQLLVTDNHPSSVDMNYMRIRGYERLSGAVYKELINSIREQRNRSVIGKSPLSMNPFAVWKAINNDPSVTLLSDINPIQNLKQQEGVTFSGTGGRSKETVMARDRVFNKSDIGVISEATSDGKDVGVSTYLTANPSIKDLRGLKGNYDFLNVGSAGVLSTSATLAPGATNDD